MTVFPQNNLPPASVPWGRAPQNAVDSSTRNLGIMSLTSESDNRATAGQMGVVGRQITELGNRTTKTTSMSSISVTATSTSFSTATGNTLLPGVGTDPRYALVVFSSPVTQGTNMTDIFVTITAGGVVVFRGTPTRADGVVPPDWGSGISATFSALVPPGGLPITVTVQAALFVAGSQTATLDNPTWATYFTDSV